ncbi:hypothetical protein [Paraburkholderia sp.]|uniref:hypothetical protein n=1 Tax=Paraburkholderia sp. TaxID=1926495 RepID=UPI0039E22CAB
MKYESDVVVASPPCHDFRSVRRKRWIACPDLRIWSINLIEEHAPDLCGQACADFERELRISAIGVLMESSAATPLWQRVCKHSMYSEIRARSTDQRLLMELALQESMR